MAGDGGVVPKVECCATAGVEEGEGNEGER
jgi:hypothetical protein